MLHVVVTLRFDTAETELSELDNVTILDILSF